MNNGKFDFYEFVARANAEFGTTDNDWDPYARVAILSFNEDPSRACAKFNGRNVYPHTMFKDRIKNGDVWIVALTPNGSSNFFAKGIKQLDASFLLELNKGDIDTVVDFIWEKNKASIEPMLEEKYKSNLQAQMAKTLEENRKEDQEKITDLSSKLAELQRVSEEDKTTIKSLEDSIEALKSSNASFAPRQGQLLPAAPFVPWGQPEEVPSVHRIGADVIMSEAFTRSRYSVHLSLDHRTMLITPDSNGNVLCLDKTITLAGLDTILPFTGDSELPCSYSNSFNGFLVTLK